MTSLRLLFAGDFFAFGGSAQTVAAYCRWADAVRIEVAVSPRLSLIDEVTARSVRLVDDLEWATHVIFVCEGSQFLTERAMDAATRLPRHRRVVIDNDGNDLPAVVVGDDDSERHYPASSWQALHRELSDVILQPCLDDPAPGATRFCYYGMDPVLARPRRPFDAVDWELQYIGNNWWRWQALWEVIDAATGLDPPFRRIRVCGRWWDEPSRPADQQATRFVAGALTRSGVALCPSVPFGRVVEAMGRAAVNAVLIRPVIGARALVTPRMVETIAASTVPIYREADAYVGRFLGDDGELCLRPGGDTLARIRRDLGHYQRKVAAMRARLVQHHAYPRVMTALRDLLRAA